jgi:RHS repeat-associated protein
MRVVARLQAIAVASSLVVLSPLVEVLPGQAAGVSVASAQTGGIAAPSICGLGSLAGRWPARGDMSYAQVYVPNNASLTVNVEGSVTPGWWTGSYRGLDVVYVQVRERDDESGPSGGDWNYQLGGVYSTPDPVAWVGVTHTWTNTGPSRTMLVRTYAPVDMSHKATANEWTVEVQSSSAMFGMACDVLRDSESDVPNDAEDVCRGDSADPVGAIQGNFWQSWTDFVVPGRGGGLDLERTYSSRPGRPSGAFGPGWAWSYGMSVRRERFDAVGTAYALVVTQETGAEVWFYPEGSQWVAPPRVNATLVATQDRLIFTRAGSDRFEFSVASASTPGRLLSVGDVLAPSHETVLTYVGDQLDRVTEASGRELRFFWSGDRIERVEGPSASLESGGSPQAMQVSYGYDAGRLSSVTDTTGGVWTFGYVSPSGATAGLIETIREPRHHGLGAAAPMVRNHYDSARRVDWQDDRLGRRTTFTYVDGATEDLSVVRDPKGNAVTYRHRDRVCIGLTVGEGAAASTWSYEVDPIGLGRTRTTDPNGAVTTATFNGRGQPTSVTSAKGTVTFAYDDSTSLLSSVSVRNPQSAVVAEVLYQRPAGSYRLTGIERRAGADSATVTFGYGLSERSWLPTSVTDERGQQWAYGYDMATGDLTSATDPLGNRSTWSFNEIGWPLQAVSPRGNAAGATASQFTSSWGYDRRGRVVRTTDPLGATTVLNRDLSGSVTSILDPVPAGSPAETTVLSRNDAGELTSVTRPDGTQLGTEYWPDGSLRAQLDGAGARTEYAWDSRGRLQTMTDPLGRVTEFGFDDGGRLRWREAPGGNCAVTPGIGCTRFEYTTANELRLVDYSDPATSDVTFGYDDLGRRVSMADTAGTSVWDWDGLGRLESFTDPVTGTVSYGYLDDGPTPTSITYPGGHTVTRGVDAAGRISSLSALWAGISTQFDYDPNSNLTTSDAASVTGIEDTRDYDRADRFTAASIRQGQSLNLTLASPRPDPEGLVGSLTGVGALTYTPNDTLGSDPLGVYTVDAADNLTGFSDGRRQRFNAGNELCYQASTNTAGCASPPAGSRTFDYDGRGNRITETAADGRVRSLVWDQADRLAAASVPVAAGAGQFSPVTPVRLLDTRFGQGSCTTTAGAPTACDRFTAGETIQVQVAGVGGVPADAAAVVLSVTAVGAAGPGWLNLYPAGAPVPSTSTVNYPAAAAVSNTAISRVGADGRVAVYSPVATDSSIDVVGWYSAPSGAGTGGEFFSLTPARTLDTRDGTGVCTPSPCDGLAAGSTTTVQVTGRAGVPSTGVQAVVLNVTVTSPAAAGWLTIYTAGTPMPATSNLNYTAGQTITGLVTVVPDANGRIAIYSAAATEVLADVAGYYTVGAPAGGNLMAPPAPVRALDTRVPSGTCSGSCATLPAGGTLSVAVAGIGPVPADASAVVVTVTAVSPAGPGWLTAYPDGTPRPLATAVSYSAGQVIANTTIVPVGTSGRISIYSAAATDVVIDLTGWFGAQPTATYTYGYDGTGLRRTRTAPDGTVSRFVWDRSGPLPLLLAEVTDAPGTSADRTVRYVHDPMGRALADVTETGGTHTTRWYHQDHLGSTRALTDTTGATVATFDYRPYGELAASTGTATTPMGWAGEYRDAETGYVYLRARYHDPTTGQFLSRDPLGLVTRQPYTYADNDPVNLTDPTGLCFWCVAGAWAAIEIAGTAWDLYDAHRTFSDDCSSPGERAAAGGLLILGAILPGNYGWIDNVGRRADDVPGGTVDNLLPGPGPRGGESPAAARGREAHRTWDYGPDFEREFTLPSGQRVDGINLQTREVVELKPNNRRAIREGQRQLDRYLNELNREYPGSPWTGRVETYQP